jgi:hypothetical protein
VVVVSVVVFSVSELVFEPSPICGNEQAPLSFPGGTGKGPPSLDGPVFSVVPKLPHVGFDIGKNGLHNFLLGGNQNNQNHPTAAGSVNIIKVLARESQGRSNASFASGGRPPLDLRGPERLLRRHGTEAPVAAVEFIDCRRQIFF